MARIFFIQGGLFLLPFMLEAIRLMVLRRKPFTRENWAGAKLLKLAALGVLISAASLLVLVHHDGAPAESTYKPAHIENGRLVPGRME